MLKMKGHRQRLRVWPLGGLLSLMLMVGATGSADAQEASEATPEASPFVQSIEAGAGLGWYDGDLGRSDGQFLRYGISRPYDFGLTLDVGRQHRFGETSFGGGVSLNKSLPGNASVTVGLSSGTGDVLAPRYRFDVSASYPVFETIVTAGYTRVQSKIENASDGYSLGLLRYFSHWIIGGHVRTDIGYPGRTYSTTVGVGATWYTWKQLYIGGGLDWGQVSYILLPGRAEVDYDAVGGHVGVSRWFNETSGLNVRLDYGETSFYRSGGITVSVFREF